MSATRTGRRRVPDKNPEVRCPRGSLKKSAIGVHATLVVAIAQARAIRTQRKRVVGKCFKLVASRIRTLERKYKATEKKRPKRERFCSPTAWRSPEVQRPIYQNRGFQLILARAGERVQEERWRRECPLIMSNILAISIN